MKFVKFKSYLSSHKDKIIEITNEEYCQLEPYKKELEEDGIESRAIPKTIKSNFIMKELYDRSESLMQLGNQEILPESNVITIVLD